MRRAIYKAMGLWMKIQQVRRFAWSIADLDGRKPTITERYMGGFLIATVGALHKGRTMSYNTHV